jgi:hypothetical protein
VVYFAANVGEAWPRESWLKMILKFTIILPVFLSLSMGLALHNSLAVIEGLSGKKSPFIRTPKYGVHQKRERLFSKAYFSRQLNVVTAGEGILGVYFTSAVVWSMYNGSTDFMPYHILLASGYMGIFMYSFRSHAR